MDLLLVTLCVGVEENDCWILEVLWNLELCASSLRLYPELLELLNCLYFLLIEGKEHRIERGPITSCHRQPSTIEILFKHLFKLII